VCRVADHPRRRPRFAFSLSLSTRIVQHGNLYFSFSFFSSLLILLLLRLNPMMPNSMCCTTVPSCVKLDPMLTVSLF
jgi:hypothetical protein